MSAVTSTLPSAASASRNRLFSRIFIYGLLVIFAIIYLMPLFVMLVTSFKTMDEIQNGNMLALPQSPTIEPWFKAWGQACVGLTCAGIKGYFWNSIKMVVPAVAISTIMGALNGYVLTKWRFPGHTLVFGLMLFACFIPFQSVLLPMATILGSLGRFGATLRDQIGMSLGFGNPTVNLGTGDNTLNLSMGGMALSVGGMMLAAAGWLTPVEGAVAQEVIDVAAVLNALRAAIPPRRIYDM